MDLSSEALLAGWLVAWMDIPKDEKSVQKRDR